MKGSKKWEKHPQNPQASLIPKPTTIRRGDPAPAPRRNAAPQSVVHPAIPRKAAESTDLSKGKCNQKEDSMRRFNLTIIVLILLLFLPLLMGGCANYNRFIEENLPAAGFDSFEYHRVAGTTSADISAINGTVENGVITVESISFSENFGPFYNFSTTIKGYTRTLPTFPVMTK